jgi:hypothetical protein
MPPRADKRSFTIAAVVFVALLATTITGTYVSTGRLGLAIRFGVLFLVMGLIGFAALLKRATTGRSAKGETCAGCKRKILFEHEAIFCDACDRALHSDCEREHRIGAHAHAPGGPFR